MRWGQFEAWLWIHEPVFCASCGRLVFRKDAHTTQMLSGRLVKLCKTCHSDWIHQEER